MCVLHLAQCTILLGGRDSSKTSETVSQGEYDGVKGFNMHYKTRSACSIPDEATNTLIITGGHYTLRKCDRYNSDGWLETLPSLKQGRRNHGCGAYLEEGGEQVFLVAGGYDGEYTDIATTELLRSTSSAWVTGRNLPRKMAGLVGVTIPPGNLYMTGGYHGWAFGDVYLFTGSSWMKVGNLKKTRGYHAVSAVVMDEEITQFCD